MRLILLALVLMLSIAPAATAEVRIVQGATGVSLSVQHAHRGIWTARDGVNLPNGFLLNPSGDLTGDGYPSHSSTRGRLLAAWLRPATSQLAIARADASGAPRVALYPVPPSVGVPTVAALDAGWLISWSSDDLTVVFTAFYTDSGGLSPIGEGQSGALLDSYRTSSAVYVVSLDRSTQVLVIGEFAVTFPHPIPAPIPSRLTRVALDSTQMPSVAPCAREEDSGLMLAWEAGRGQVASIRLSDGDVEGPTVQRGPSGSCAALLNAAR
jgi:hypothetical protein